MLKGGIFKIMQEVGNLNRVVEIPMNIEERVQIFSKKYLVAKSFTDATAALEIRRIEF